MAKEEKKAPKLRFNGYTNDWERKKLGIYVPITMGQSPNSKNYTSNPRDNILVQGNADLYNNRVLKRTFTTEVTKTADKDDILMSVRAPVGDIARNQYESIVIGRGIAAIKGNNFLYYQLEKMNDSGFWKKYIAGSTFESINGKDLKSSDIYISNYKEEKSIGNIFQTLTKTIQLHERKCEELALIKQALFQKLFPKKDEVIPEVRYKSFSAAWEQRKLGGVAKFYSGGTPSVGVSDYYDGTIPFIRSAEINSTSTELYLSELGLQNSSAKMVHRGDILYALYGATSGEVGISKINGAINQAILAIIPHKGYNSEFLEQWLRKNKEAIIKTYLQGGQGNLSGAIVKQIKVSFPSFDEQQKIGKSFQKIDSLITLHQRKLEKLKQLKKFLLQNMFI